MSDVKQTGRGWALMILVLGIESLLMAWLVWGALSSVIRDSQNPLLAEYLSSVMSQGIAIVLILILTTAWVAGTCVGAVKRKSWARASNLTVQVLAIAAATGVIQGIIGPFALGVTLLTLGIAGLIGSYLARPRTPVK